MSIYKVILSKQVKRDVLKMPKHIVQKLRYWIDEVSHHGLSYVRRIPGFHDEPLKGARKGQRSIRLSKAYRAIYKINEFDKIEFIEVIEVSKHEY